MNFYKGLILVTLAFFSLAAQAQVVEKVKNQNVLIDIQGGLLTEGSEWLTVNDVGRKTGWIKITKIKDNKAIAQIVKGIVAPGQTLTAKPASKSRFKGDESDSASNDSSSSSSKKKSKAGASVGYGMDSASVSGSGYSYSLSGSAFSVMGFYDYDYSNTWTFRLRGGYDAFNVTTSIASTNVNLAITYLAAGADAQYYFSKAKTYWAGIGYTTGYLLSVSAGFTPTNSTTFENYMSPGFGWDFKINQSFFMPFAFHYDYYFPMTGIASQSAIRINFGAGFMF
jgi:hypothetical protein